MKNIEFTTALDIVNKSEVKNIVYFVDELLAVVRLAPTDDHKEKHIHNFLNMHLKGIDLTESFNSKMSIIYDELLSVEIMLSIHSWVKKQSCNIENIFFITTHTLGLTEWYKKYIDIMQESGFVIIEAPLLADYVQHYQIMESIDSIEPLSNRTDLKYYFDYYGGTYYKNDRDFLAAMFMQLADIGHVEYMSGFSPNQQEFDNYLERITEFRNRKLCDDILLIRNQSNLNNKQIDCNETRSLVADMGLNKAYNQQSACQVIRETDDTLPFSSITEKTLKSMLHGQIVIPMGYNAVHNLESLGFKFDHSLIDYSYQFEPIFCKRIINIVDQIISLSQKLTLIELEKHLVDQQDLLLYNYNYIKSGTFFENVRQKLIEQLND